MLKQMMDWLFDYKVFITRDHCGKWGPGLINLNQWSNLLIFVSYTLISGSLLYFWLKKRLPIKESWTVVGFFSFIFLCGLTHLGQFLTFYYPMYRLFTWVDWSCGVISFATWIYLIYTAEYFLGLPKRDIAEEMEQQVNYLVAKQLERFKKDGTESKPTA